MVSGLRTATRLMAAGAVFLAACAPAASPSPPPAATSAPAAKPTTAPAQPAAAPSPAAAAASPAVAAASPVAAAKPGNLEKVSLRLDFVAAGTQAPFFLALDRGYYAAEGLDVSIGDGRGSGVTVQSVGAGQDTFGWAAVSATADAISHGVPIKSIAMITNANSYGAFVDEKSSIQTLKDLLGKTILIVAGSPDQYLTRAVMEANGLDSSQVHFQSTDASAKVSLYTQGQGDAMVTTVPYGSPIVQPKRPSRILRFTDFGLTLSDFGIVTSLDELQKSPDTVQRFVRASLRGWQDAQADPKAAAQAQVKYRPDLPLDIAVEQATQQMNFLFSKRTQGKPIGCASPQDWADGLALLQKYAGLQGDISDTSKFFTNQYVPGCT